MKRDLIKKYLKIKTIYPIFWKKCNICGMDYRLEKMTKMRSPLNKKVFICSHCSEMFNLKKD